MNIVKPVCIVIAALAAVTILSACAPQAAQIPTAALPAGKAWAEGKEIYFVHTEASDAGIAEKLTNMMKSPVFHVPSLAKTPADSLAPVYVFENGVAGKGPLGFQGDVFPNPPGTAGYTPLRSIHLVKWADPTKARELKSAADVLAAQKANEVTIIQPGVVVNMPFVVWDGGKR
ncbi:MAG: hypothetical protein FJ011_16400 [Chloroflexi bacterium]|nr:hypothetical protein [Chloroflexota bacterium]